MVKAHYEKGSLTASYRRQQRLAIIVRPGPRSMNLKTLSDSLRLLDAKIGAGPFGDRRDGLRGFSESGGIGLGEFRSSGAARVTKR